jgi:hypothetical protein
MRKIVNEFTPVLVGVDRYFSMANPSVSVARGLFDLNVRTKLEPCILFPAAFKNLLSDLEINHWFLMSELSKSNCYFVSSQQVVGLFVPAH